MTRIHRSGLVFAAGLALAAAAQAAATPAPSSDQADVVRAMRTMYEAATQDDLALFHTVAAPEFYAFDNGKRFDGDALMELIKTLHAAGNSYVWTVTEPEVRIFGDTALITYVNRGSVRDPSGEKSISWLESAVLRKDQGTWRIVFFHSTRVP
jgi:ketosteroid isomerase-like protein